MTLDAITGLLLSVNWLRTARSIRRWGRHWSRPERCCSSQDASYNHIWEGGGDGFPSTPIEEPSMYPDITDHPDQIPTSWWVWPLPCFSVGTILTLQFWYNIPWTESALAIPLSIVLSYIAVRCTGETDINPVGGMGKVTQLVFAGVAPGNLVSNLMTAAVTAAGASQAGDLLQDMKTGQLVNVSPRHIFIAQCIGIPAGVAFCVPIFKLFEKAYKFGDEACPAPSAQAWKAVAQILASGLGSLESEYPYSIYGIAVAAAVGILLPVLRKVAELKAPAWRDTVPSGTAFGLAFIIAPDQGFTLFMGSFFCFLWSKRNQRSFEELGYSVASGLIAGSGLSGVVNAMLKLFEVPTAWNPKVTH
mmetsp:Transcript_44314/g.104103  ORF Transcript_44314/g.104103 Transcript_44314/m.104103 type:complete len:361 (+) Transcript_44314:1-1083(+)